MRAISSLYGLGLSIQREKIRQADPTLDAEGVERQLRQWLDCTGHIDPAGPDVIRTSPRRLGDDVE